MTLYENEAIQMYDPYTGQYVENTAQPQHEEEIKLLIEEGKRLEEMTKTEGWSQVSLFIQHAVELYKTKLLTCVDLDQMRRLQEAIKAYSNILHFVTQKINESKSFDITRTPDSLGQSKGE